MSGDVLTANLIGALPEEHRRLLESTAIGVLPTRSINACVIKVPSGGEVIGFDYGTMSFMLMLNKILLSRTNLFNFEPTLGFKDAAILAAKTVKSFFYKNVLPRITIIPRKMLIASSLSNIQTTFILGHEIGHILLRHLRRYTESNFAEHSHEQEYAADIRGVELVLSSFKRSFDPLFGDSDITLSQAGFDLFFTYIIFIEDFIKKDSSQSSSHPDTRDRLAKIRHRFWDEYPENAKKLASEGEKLFSAFSNFLKNESDGNEIFELDDNVEPESVTRFFQSPNTNDENKPDNNQFVDNLLNDGHENNIKDEKENNESDECYEEINEEVEFEPNDKKVKKVLIIAVCPRDMSKLRLGQEVRDISSVLRNSKNPRFIVEVRWAVRMRDLRSILFEFEPQIVNFFLWSRRSKRNCP